MFAVKAVIPQRFRAQRLRISAVNMGILAKNLIDPPHVLC